MGKRCSPFYIPPTPPPFLIKLKGLNRIAKMGYDHLWLREENLSFINNYII